MNGHTPGPWTAHQYGVRDVGGYICALKWPSLYTGQDERYWRETAERQADARLIAAAPDLLAALQALLNTYNDGGVPLSQAFALANSAIAKALTTTPESN